MLSGSPQQTCRWILQVHFQRQSHVQSIAIIQIQYRWMVICIFPFKTSRGMGMRELTGEVGLKQSGDRTNGETELEAQWDSHCLGTFTSRVITRLQSENYNCTSVPGSMTHTPFILKGEAHFSIDTHFLLPMLKPKQWLRLRHNRQHLEVRSFSCRIYAPRVTEWINYARYRD